MSSSISPQNNHEYEHVNVDSHLSPMGNAADGSHYHNDSLYTTPASLRYSTSCFGERKFLSSPSTSSSWYSHPNANQSHYALNQDTEQPLSGSWMPQTTSYPDIASNGDMTSKSVEQWQVPKTFYSDAQQKPYLTPTLNCNASYSQRNYGTATTNPTHSFQSSGRMSHLFNAVEFAVNNVTSHLNNTKSSMGHDGTLVGPVSLSMLPPWVQERKSFHKGYQRHNPYVFHASCHQGNQEYSNGMIKGQVSYCCPNCKRVYNWKYNLTRHLRYECGTESRFQCAHCKRCFPHKQNAIHHNIRKHRIHHEKNHLYVDNGDVIIKAIL